tara:strand:- start:578 stop:976 length:399 start_codon:yes stop_codon:yes gene_type:complete
MIKKIIMNTNNKRPLSPHITVHKWILSQIMSILHRATAIGFSLSTILISLWLVSISLGPEYYSIFALFFFNFLGKIFLVLILFCFYFYFLDEIRKTFWGIGIGLDIKIIKFSSYVVFSLTLLIVLLLIIYFL